MTDLMVASIEFVMIATRTSEDDALSLLVSAEKQLGKGTENCVLIDTAVKLGKARWN